MIEASAITFGYPPGPPLIEGWTEQFRPGEVVAITGASGSGKSTLLYLLGTLVRPWSGTLRIFGRDVGPMGDAGRSRVRAELVGFLFQDALLDARRSVLDNVVEGAIYRGDSRNDAMLRGRDLLLELGVDVELDRPANNLSGGQAQRVALCRALLGDPRVVLADEPTGNLDASNADVVRAVLFQRARAGATVVIVTHDEGLAGTCDRVIRL